MVAIYTIQMGKWRLAKQNNIPLLDITAKSGKSYFAPSFNNVMEYKAGLMSQADYTNQYTLKMRQSLMENRDKWDEVINSEKIALACYCNAGDFCHRYLLTDMLAKYAKSRNISFQNVGELI